MKAARPHNLHSVSVFPVRRQKKVGSFHGRNAFGSMKHISFRRGNSSKRAKNLPFVKRTRPVDYQNGVFEAKLEENLLKMWPLYLFNIIIKMYIIFKCCLTNTTYCPSQDGTLTRCFGFESTIQLLYDCDYDIWTEFCFEQSLWIRFEN